MDAPNTPYPNNPNAQNPVDQVQDQNQDQNQDQVPVGQVSAHVPVQSVPQPVPAELAPAGVMPIPQVFLSNLDR